MRNINDTDTSEEDISVTSTSEIIELRQKENWKNRSKSPKKRKSLYLTNHPEIKAKRTSKLNITIDNVRNGNCLNPTPVKIGGKTIKYKLINTCPFDAVLQAIATVYIDSIIFANYVDSLKFPMLELSKYLVNNGANLELYKQRAKILENTGRKRRLICGLMELDCQFNVTNLIEILMKDAPSIWEYHTCNIEAT